MDTRREREHMRSSYRVKPQVSVVYEFVPDEDAGRRVSTGYTNSPLTWYVKLIYADK